MKKIILASLFLTLAGCDVDPQVAPASTTGVTKAQANVKTQSNGLTVEQENIKRRIEMENQPGSIKHLYVISAYSGQVLLYSTVKGKVTSSGKRLTPYSVAVQDGRYIESAYGGFSVGFNGSEKRTGEVLQDDGTYGSSVDYLYWWDVKGNYHQHYVSGGQMVHISDQPMTFGRVTMSIEKIKP